MVYNQITPTTNCDNPIKFFIIDGATTSDPYTDAAALPACGTGSLAYVCGGGQNKLLIKVNDRWGDYGLAFAPFWIK